MKRSLLIFTIAVAAFVAGVSVRGLLSSPLESADLKHQSRLPQFSLLDLSNKPHDIKEWEGKVLVINFWATWCPPCLKEMPEFVALQNEYQDKGLQFIGIALDEPEPVKEFIDSHKITYPVLLGGDQGMAIAHGMGNVVNTVPFTVIIDRKGNIIQRQMGTLSREQLLKIIAPLL
jgi:thiol-disulfide isomerase/thioredoxin